MVQSFWLTGEWKEFKKYTKWIEKEYTDMKSTDLKEHLANWKKGRAKLTQEAISWGVDLKISSPVFLSADANSILHTDKGISYIDPSCEGVKIIGLHRGKCYWEDDVPIFNIDFFHEYIKDCDTKEEADWKLKLYVKFHGIGEV